MLTVYVPRPGSPLASSLKPGTALVAAAAGPGRVRCYYQPPSPAVNVKTFADRAYHAASRLTHQSATHMVCSVDTEELVEVGMFDDREGRVLLTGSDASAQLAAWLGDARLDSCELDCAGTEHFQRRRDWETASRSPNPALARFARQQLASLPDR